MRDPTPTTFLFTDIEGSTRLWEQEPERMRDALAAHDAIARSAVETFGGVVVKMTGDGVHAVFDDPVDATLATVRLQQSLAETSETNDIELKVRCGLHLGAHEFRDNDFYRHDGQSRRAHHGGRARWPGACVAQRGRMDR